MAFFGNSAVEKSKTQAKGARKEATRGRHGVIEHHTDIPKKEDVRGSTEDKHDDSYTKDKHHVADNESLDGQEDEKQTVIDVRCGVAAGAANLEDVTKGSAGLNEVTADDTAGFSSPEMVGRSLQGLTLGPETGHTEDTRGRGIVEGGTRSLRLTGSPPTSRQLLCTRKVWAKALTPVVVESSLSTLAHVKKAW